MASLKDRALQGCKGNPLLVASEQAVQFLRSMAEEGFQEIVGKHLASHECFDQAQAAVLSPLYHFCRHPDNRAEMPTLRRGCLHHPTLPRHSGSF